MRIGLMKTFFRTKARSATSLSPGGRALAMRGFAWPQSTSKRQDNIRKRFSTIRIAKQPRCIAHWGVCSGADGCSAHNTQKASAIKPETSSPVTHTCLASRSPACPPPSAWRLAGPHRLTPTIAIPPKHDSLNTKTQKLNTKERNKNSMQKK